MTFYCSIRLASDALHNTRVLAELAEQKAVSDKISTSNQLLV